MKHIKTFIQLFESELIEESKTSDLKSMLKKNKIDYEKFFQSLDDMLSNELDDDMVASIMDYLTDDGEMSKEVKSNKKLIDSSIKKLLNDMGVNESFMINEKKSNPSDVVITIHSGSNPSTGQAYHNGITNQEVFDYSGKYWEDWDKTTQREIRDYFTR